MKICIEDECSIDHLTLNDEGLDNIVNLSFNLRGRDVLQELKRRYKPSLMSGEVVTMKVVVELDKRKVQG